jgi:hypothetical protein
LSKRKLDIINLLQAVDRCDGDWLQRQPADVRREFAPPVAMRWTATLAKDGDEAAYMLWVVNEHVNLHLYDLHKHPDLIFRLLATCGVGSQQKHVWLAPPTRLSKANAAATLVASVFPEASDAEISLLLDQFDRTSFGEFVKGCGVQEKDAKEVMNAYDKLFPKQIGEKGQQRQ